MAGIYQHADASVEVQISTRSGNIQKDISSFITIFGRSALITL